MSELIKYRNVEICQDEQIVLTDVNLSISSGEMVYLLGRVGSGKSSLMKTIYGELPVEGTMATALDYDLLKLRRREIPYLRRKVGVVFQDFQLLAFPLGQNVAAAKDYDPVRAEDCLRKAGFGDRLDSLPDGLETCLYREFDQKGVEISGGEAQKIAIARALYKDAPFIILDEPTAALDPIAEAEIYSKFNDIAGDKTAIYISHRLSSCKFCDEIAVFHEGAVVQQGTHAELVADVSGKYHELWNAQAQYYTEKNA